MKFGFISKLFQGKSKDALGFDELNILLIKKISEEVKKLDFKAYESEKNLLKRKIQHLLDENEIEYRLEDRLKDEFSIINKVVRKIDKVLDLKSKRSFQKSLKKLNKEVIQGIVLDLIGFRIIVETQEDCYEVFSLLRKEKSFKFLKNKSCDYINKRKRNGYKAIHYVGLEKHNMHYFEVQIMTEKMKSKATNGRAGRKRYKKKKNRKYIRNILVLSSITAAGGIYYWFKRKGR